MELPVEREPGGRFLQQHEFSGDVQFKEVHFSYSQQGRPSLENISFHVKAGEKVGIIGRVGSGKSTLTKLALGLYEPDRGSVLNSDEGINVSLLNTVDLVDSSSTEDLFDGSGNYIGELYTALLEDGAVFFTLQVNADGTYDFNLVTPNPTTTITEGLQLTGSVGGNSADLYAEEIAAKKGLPDPQTDIRFTAHDGYTSGTNLGSATTVNTNNFGIGAGSSAGGLRVTNGESLTLEFLQGDADLDPDTHPTDTQAVDSVALTFDVSTDNSGDETVTVTYILHLEDGSIEFFEDNEVLDGGTLTLTSTSGLQILSVDVVNEDIDGDSFFISGAETTIETEILPDDLLLDFGVEVVDGDGDSTSDSFQITIDTDGNVTGTSGDDLLIAGDGSIETFIWSDGDSGTDTVTGFNVGEGDVLDISDLIGDVAEDSSILDSYLNFSLVDGNTVIEVDADGALNGSSTDQTIVLEGVDLTSGGTLTDVQIIDSLLPNNLVTDVV